MKIFDLARLSLKVLRHKWIALPITGIAVTTFCFCFAGAILTTVQQEKALPYELIVLPGNNNITLTDSFIADLLDVQGILEVTPVLQIPVHIETGEYSAQITITGMDASYLKEPFSQGNIFPNNSVMPYIILNEAALKQFSDGKTKSDTDTDEPDIDWLNASFSLKIDEEGRKISSKICGILLEGETDDGQDPVAYISLPVMKDLLRKNRMSTDYTAFYARITNIGHAESVSRSLAAFGVSVTNSNTDLQFEWDLKTREMVYLFLIGIFCLDFSVVLMNVYWELSLIKQLQEWKMLLWMGFKRQHISKVFSLQCAELSIAGITLGIIAAIAGPKFLSPETATETVFSMAVPFGVIAISILICLASGQLFAFIILKRKISKAE